VPRDHRFLVHHFPLLLDPEEVAVDNDVVAEDLALPSSANRMLWPGRK
jgi:hypothetical protein